jgi:hypothetical protein
MFIPLTVEVARTLAGALRAVDRSEILACITTPDLEAWAELVAGTPGKHVAILDSDGNPGAMGGLMVANGHTANSWFVATDRLETDETLGVNCHRAALALHADATEQGVRRFQAWSHIGNIVAHQWLERLGYQQEGAHPWWGNDSSTFLSFGRVA